MRFIGTLLLGLFFLCIAVTATAQSLCPEDDFQVATRGDSILVTHRHAERNCCSELALSFNVDGSLIDFFEGEIGEPCDCMCCFDLQYTACGFAPGHYTVRFWNGDGTVLYGSKEVEVGGGGLEPMIVSTDLGKCVGPTPVTIGTWSVVKRLYQ